MADHSKQAASQKSRPFIGIKFECCNAYRRIYLTADKSAFAGSCPKCGAPVRIRTGPGGSKSRFWTVG